MVGPRTAADPPRRCIAPSSVASGEARSISSSKILIDAQEATDKTAMHARAPPAEGVLRRRTDGIMMFCSAGRGVQ